MKNNFIIFVMVNFICGITAFIGSTLGHTISQTAVFAGAILGGITGIVLSTSLFVKRKLIARERFQTTTIGGSFFFGAAVLFAVTNLDTPIIPLISLSFVGLGCVAGKSY